MWSWLLFRNEVDELLEAELIRLIHIQRWNLGSRSVDPKGPSTRRLYPHGGKLLLIKERIETCPSSLKDYEEEKEVVWRAFTIFMFPEKRGPDRIG